MNDKRRLSGKQERWKAVLSLRKLAKTRVLLVTSRNFYRISSASKRVNDSSSSVLNSKKPNMKKT